MHRIHVPGAREFIRETIELLPARLQELLRPVDFLIGLDPNFVGLHVFAETPEGSSFCDVPHVAFLVHQPALPRAERQTTVVLQAQHLWWPEVLLHELGHALDEQLGFSVPVGPPLGEHAATHRWEAVATAFQAWASDAASDDEPFYTRATVKAKDPRTVAFWDSLCRGAA